MSAAPRCLVLYTLVICGLVSATGYAAAIAQPGGQGAQASDGNQKRDAAPGAANARPNLSRRWDVEHPLSRIDPIVVGTRRFGATRPGAKATSRSAASLKPLAAGNGAIGGPRTAARVMIGGAVTGKSVLKASIDGTALRRRF